MPDVFLSYAREDKVRAREIAEALEDQGYSVWWDRTIRPGKTFEETIEAALIECRCVVVLWSKASVSSTWVRNEAEEGKRRGILVPVSIDEVVPPLGLRHIQHADLSHWEPGSADDGFKLLKESIASLLRPVAQDHPPARVPPPPAPPVRDITRPRERSTANAPSAGRTRNLGAALGLVLVGVVLGAAGTMLITRKASPDPRAALEQLVEAERNYFGINKTYARDGEIISAYSSTGTTPLEGVTLDILEATDNGYRAIALVAGSDEGCVVYVGANYATFPATVEGEPECAATSLINEVQKRFALLAVLKSDLRNLVTAQEAYFADNVTYTVGITSIRRGGLTGALSFTPSVGVTVVITAASGTGWNGYAVHKDLEGSPNRCGIFVGSAPAPHEGMSEGEPLCW